MPGTPNRVSIVTASSVISVSDAGGALVNSRNGSAKKTITNTRTMADVRRRLRRR